MHGPPRGAGIVVAVLVVCAGCGAADTLQAEAISSTAPAMTTTAEAVPTTTTSSTTTRASSSTTNTTTTTTTAGEPVAGPPPGTVWGVVAVPHDDVLNVRAGPGVDNPIIATLEPGAIGIVAIGTGYGFERSLWWEIETGDGTGWVNAAYLAAPGAVDDITAAIVAALGEIPAAPSLEELGDLVASMRVGEEPVARVVVVVAPTVADLGEITMDVVGIGDDAIYGERLHIFAFPPQDDAGFVLKTVERTFLCGRAATEDGLCV